MPPSLPGIENRREGLPRTCIHDLRKGYTLLEVAERAKPIDDKSITNPRGEGFIFDRLVEGPHLSSACSLANDQSAACSSCDDVIPVGRESDLPRTFTFEVPDQLPRKAFPYPDLFIL